MGVDRKTSVFTGEPQPVEIHHRGIWYSGELLGWRHESDGRVLARVRCIVDRLRHSAWKDLTELRLPDPARPPRAEPFPAPPPRSQATDPDAVDATQPHVLLPGMRTRPAKPAHAVTPPAPAQAPPPAPRPTARPQRMPAPPVRTAARADEFTPSDRRRPRPERQPAQLSGV